MIIQLLIADAGLEVLGLIHRATGYNILCTVHALLRIAQRGFACTPSGHHFILDQALAI